MDDPQIVVDAIVAACTDPKLDQPVGYKAKAANEGAEAEDNGPGLFGDEAGAQAAE